MCSLCNLWLNEAVIVFSDFSLLTFYCRHESIALMWESKVYRIDKACLLSIMVIIYQLHCGEGVRNVVHILEHGNIMIHDETST